MTQEPRSSSHDVPRTAQPIDDALTWKDAVAALHEGAWLIGAAAALALAAALAYAVAGTPVYSSDVVVQVEERPERERPSDVQEFTEMFALKTAADTEIEILRSRSLLGAVVEQLGLDVEARPRTFPVIGGFWRRAAADDAQPRAAPLGLTRFAWGGERIRVTSLRVRERELGQQLRLTALADGRYALRDDDGRLLLQGAVGHAEENGATALQVSELRARPGTEFLIVKRPVDEVVKDLQKHLAIGETGKKTGLIRVALEGENPQRLATVLNAIGDAYANQNVDRKAAEAGKTLSLVTAQIPEQHAILDAAERALNQYQSSHGSVNVSLETSSLIERATQLERQLSDLRLQRDELHQRFTDGHESLIAVARKVESLQAERAGIEDRIKRRPQTELESARLTRDVRVANELYVNLLNKAQELRIVKSGTIGNVRVLDRAPIPRKPVRPYPWRDLPLALAAGLAVGLIGASVKKFVLEGIEDPQQLEVMTGSDILGTIPHSRAQVRLSRSLARRTTRGGEVRILAELQPGDVAVEGFRGLWTNVQASLADARSNVIALVGPSPRIGKSFVTLNLAHVIAGAGTRVLLIDADLRKGALHRAFGLRERSPGLSELLSTPMRFEDAVRRSVADHLDLLPTGAFPEKPAELLRGTRLQELIERVSGQYDFVIADTPPSLAVTDASLVSRVAGTTLMVLRAREHSARELQNAMRSLARAGVHASGIVINDFVSVVGRYGYGYYRYGYESEREREAS
jgi:tyrosine-protein kinase Etk/Wzc